MKPRRNNREKPPLDSEKLERLALFYVGRYATTASKLRSYLLRKIKERGSDGAHAAVEPLIERFRELRYIDDAAFASARAASLQRRGFGARRVAQSLHAAGIAEEDAAEANEEARGAALASALRFAERRRIGPYAAEPLDREERQRAFGAMMRAGHSPEIARRVLNASPGEIPDSDNV